MDMFENDRQPVEYSPVCVRCGDNYPVQRAKAGYRLCLLCGDDSARKQRASWCIAPMHKSNYVLITNPADLIGINVKAR